MDVVRKRRVGVWDRDRGGAEIEDKMLPITPWLNCKLSFQGKVWISFLHQHLQKSSEYLTDYMQSECEAKMGSSLLTLKIALLNLLEYRPNIEFTLGAFIRIPFFFFFFWLEFPYIPVLNLSYKLASSCSLLILLSFCTFCDKFFDIFNCISLLVQSNGFLLVEIFYVQRNSNWFTMGFFSSLTTISCLCKTMR